jgi:hypothetical protein
MNIVRTLFLLTLTISCAGQTVEDLQAKAKASKVNKEIFITYDKFKDQSAIITKPYNLIGSMAGAMAIMSKSRNMGMMLMMDFRYTFKGERIEASPDKFYLVFTSSSNDWLFLKGDRNAYFLYDDSRLELKPVDRDSDVGRQYVSEFLDTYRSDGLSFNCCRFASIAE